MNLSRFLLALVLGAGLLEPAAAPVLAAPQAAVRCGAVAGGLIGDHWRSLGAEQGPLGCPTGAEQVVPGRAGRRQVFERGEVVWSPDQGAAMVVSAYLSRNDVVVDWGAALAADSFPVTWFHSGLSRTETVAGGPRTSGTFSMPLTRGPGRYEFAVAGAVPAGVTVSDLAGAPGCPGAPAAGGLIGQRWQEMGAGAGKLGCPTGGETANPGRRGRQQSFEHGQLVWSPEQGERVVVAVYSVRDRVFVEWGPTDGYHYDLFLVRWTTPGGGAKQQEVTHARDKRREGFSSFGSGGGRVEVEVEGCDRSILGTTCNQGWTARAATEVRASTDIDLAGMTATDPARAFTALDRRKAAAVDSYACQQALSPYGGRLGEDQGILLMAHLDRVRRLGADARCAGQVPSAELVNRVVRMANPYATGSSTDDIPTCHRDADYDAVLKSLVVLAAKYGDLLLPRTRAHLLHHLFTENGPHSVDDEKITVCSLVDVPETENHRLLIESARHLANQLLFDATGDPRYDNNANGLKDFLLGQLQQFAKFDFLEFNSRPYQRYSMNALFNLYDFAREPEVRTAARIVLDYTTTKFAVSSNQLRRAGPFRRLGDRRDEDNHSYYAPRSDTQTGFFQLWTGLAENTGRRLPVHFAGEAVIAAVSGYLPPPAAVRVAMVKTAGPYQQTFHHGRRPRLSFSPEDAAPGVEIYSSSPSYLLSAGGVWLPSGYGLDELRGTAQKGRAQGTTLMPTRNFPGRETRWEDLVRFDGLKLRPETDRDRVNTCVRDGFACGVGVQVPPQWLDCGQPRRQGAWLFLNLDTVTCGRLGLYVVVHSSRVLVNAAANYSDTTGFLHAVEAGTMGFADFQDKTLAANPGVPDDLLPSTEYGFASADGHRYVFVVTYAPEESKYRPLVRSVDGVTLPDWTATPLVTGRYLSSTGHDGLLTLAVPECGARTELDFRDARRPAVRVVSVGFADPRTTSHDVLT